MPLSHCVAHHVWSNGIEALNWNKIAWAMMALPSAIFIGVHWMVGIEVEAWPLWSRWALGIAIIVGMVTLGREQSRREKENDTWMDDPRKSRIENWADKRRQRFSPKRGLGFFVAGLVVFSVMIGVTALSSGVASTSGAVLVVLGFSALAGLIGTFTEKVPL